MNALFQNALQRQPQKSPPIWFMRQAGRYHKHYQGLRQKYSFMDLCKIPELACEVALGPVQEFDFDVSILFSDLLFPLEALGMGLVYDPGPKLGWQLRPDNFHRLKSWQEALPSLKFQGQATALTRAALPSNKSLIGFVGGPWTLFSYAVQGGHDGNLIQSKKMLPHFDQFCKILLPLLQANIQLQLDAGAEIVMLFDTSAGELDPATYRSFVVPKLQELARHFPKRLGYYSKNTHRTHLVEEVFCEQWAGLGIDHKWNLPMLLKSKTIGSGFWQGNFDQALLHMETVDFERALNTYLQSFELLNLDERAGWVSGLGHGVLPETPEKHVHLFIETVRKRFG